jgi:hypothetical protein
MIFTPKTEISEDKQVKRIQGGLPRARRCMEYLFNKLARKENKKCSRNVRLTISTET